VARNCPKAFVAIISNPVNSTVPIFAEQMKKNGTSHALLRPYFTLLVARFFAVTLGWWVLGS